MDSSQDSSLARDPYVAFTTPQHMEQCRQCIGVDDDRLNVSQRLHEGVRRHVRHARRRMQRWLARVADDVRRTLSCLRRSMTQQRHDGTHGLALWYEPNRAISKAGR